MNFNANDIESWASEYADVPDVKRLISLVEADRNLPQPSSLRPGSPERQLAQARQERLSKLAVSLGYKPPVNELAHTVAAEAVKSSVLGATGIAETPLGERLEKMPAPEKSTKAERKKDRGEKLQREKREAGLGLERVPV
jgi:hypothetical protein